MRIGETPVPIPNTMVKTYTADGTALETVWESRWPPVHGDIAQLGEHLPCKQGVESSNLFISIRIENDNVVAIHCTLKISHGEKCLYKRLNLKYNIEDIEIYLMYILMRTKKRLYLG